MQKKKIKKRTKIIPRTGGWYSSQKELSELFAYTNT